MRRATVWLHDSRQADMEVPADWLSGGEVLRYGRFLRAERQRQYLLGRVLARKAIGALLGVAPRGVVLDERSGQAPALIVPAAPQVGFSIAHSGHWVACAVSADTRLGLDVETLAAGRDLLALAEQAFSFEHFEALARLAPAGRLAAFYDMWCEQEARIKLGGEGESCVALAHPELAIALCSLHKLDAIDLQVSG